ncbi:uncharacterized protein LOC143301626 [Babylonia areolata]|uniref:uncharacterized protein LOC143301626 n=1 Tax=Babylonia areolata TaxID=304850 RepID=UPI003FD3A9D5
MEERLLCLWVVGSAMGLTCCETKCYRNEEIGDKEGNVYFCPDDDKPECCEQDLEFTCCETTATKSGREQAQLWCTVAALVLVVGLVFLCCKYDVTCCNGDERTIAQRLGLRKKPAPEPRLTDLTQAGPMDDTTDNRRRFGGLPPLPSETGHHNSGFMGDDGY